MNSMAAKTRTKKPKDVKLDMEHGFIKSIIKNQLDRDRYEKEVKEKSAQESPQSPAVRSRGPRATPRRPDRAIYTPPVGRPEPVAPPPPPVLFELEYCDSRTGAIRQQPFVEGTDLAEFCATFAQKAGLDAPLERALHDRLRKEMPSEE